jgi:hypothetical protein
LENQYKHKGKKIEKLETVFGFTSGAELILPPELFLPEAKNRNF